MFKKYGIPSIITLVVAFVLYYVTLRILGVYNFYCRSLVCLPLNCIF